MVSDRIRVLHIDDEPGLAEATTKFLERGDDGITVETATDADEALGRLGENGYDCVVSDYEMPGKDGIEFLEEVRKEFPDLPFVLFTGKGSEEVASEAVSAGVTDYIQKGYGSEAYELLANSIKKAVRARRDARKVARQDELMRLTEAAGKAGGFELDIETGRLLLTGGARRLIDAPEDERFHLEDGIELYHPKERDRVREVLEEVIETGERADGTFRVVIGDERRTWDVKLTPVTENGEVRKVRGIVNDITEQSERERELERYEAFVENSLDMTTHMDTDGNVLYLSPAAERGMGRDAEARRGGGGFEYIHPEDRDGMAEEFRGFIEDPEKETTEVVYRSQREDGEYIWLETVAVDMTDTDIGGVIANSRDVTERERRKERVRRQKERLDDFAGVVSHDLRNPLSVAKVRLELAQKECDSEHLDSVGGALGRMETLIEDLLALAREGSGIGEMEVIETEEFLEDCRRNVDTGDATVAVELERSIEADPSRLKQLFENLVRNAVEHGGKDVTVTVGELEDRNGFYVADDGEGIPKEKREEVFEAGHSTSEGGTGFGLSIVEEIVTAHGWDIEATESETGGARFEVSGVGT